MRKFEAEGFFNLLLLFSQFLIGLNNYRFRGIAGNVVNLYKHFFLKEKIISLLNVTKERKYLERKWVDRNFLLSESIR